MKQVYFTKQALLQMEGNVQKLVEGNYFSEEDYAVEYVRDIFRYFSLNMENLISNPAPQHFNQYKESDKPLLYVRYRKSRRTTWYAFFEEHETSYNIVYLGNNQLIGQYLA